jgi:E3 ubiquitin-protein ligase DOA10
MAIELAVFPLVMGSFLDICFLPLFAGATIAGRVTMTVQHPLLSFFAHWLAGTLFMSVT